MQGEYHVYNAGKLSLIADCILMVFTAVKGDLF